MDVVPLWQKFKQLGQLDLSILQTSSSIDSLTSEAARLRKELDQETVRLQTLKAQFLTSSQALKEQEAAATDLQEKLAHKLKMIDTASDMKQQTALEHEATTIKNALAKADDLYLNLLEKQVAVRNAYHAQEAKHAVLQPTSEARMTAIEQELAALSSSATSANSSHEQLEASISDEWLKKYRALKEKIADPLVPALGQSCSGCFYLILNQDFTRLKNSAILQCRNCFRLLYFDSENV